MDYVRRIAGHSERTPRERRRSVISRAAAKSGATQTSGNAGDPGVTIDNSGELGIGVGPFSVDVNDGGINLKTGYGTAVDIT